MSNRPHQRPDVSEKSVAQMLQTEPGQRIAATVEKIKAFCDVHQLDFDEVSGMFQSYAASSDKDLPAAVESFYELLRVTHQNMVDSGAERVVKDSKSLILPGDKDFR